MITSKIRLIEWLHERVMTELPVNGGSVCAEGTIINWIAGSVQSQHVSLVRAGVRIKVGERTNLRVRWPISDERLFVIGQRVVATIPAEAVRLEAGIFRRSKQRWNRWIGRVVLVQREHDHVHVTVKIHGDEVILKSVRPLDDKSACLRTWDIVNIVVDPTCILLRPGLPSESTDLYGFLQ